jgi:two-component system phosphate regulon sensor histidine kinase PhoR
MQNRYIKILIASISVAVLSLIGMQYYWVQSSVELRKEDFNRSVKDALEAVSEYLENYETMNQLKAQEQNRYLFIDDNAEEKIFAAGGDTTYDYLMVERLVQDGQTIELSVTEEMDGKKVSDRKKTFSNQIPKFSSSSGNLSDALAFSSSKPFRALSLNNEVQERIAYKNAYIGEIEKSLTKINFTDKLEERIDSLFLDSLLHLALQEKGLGTEFEFGVFDSKGVFRFGNPSIVSEKLQDSPHQIRLFKHDLVGKPGYLKVYFPKEKGLILSSSMWMLLTSIIVVMAIIYMFYWTLKAIITQKKNSEIKNDFINNMTHELKTPISTISLAVEVLNDPAMGKNEGLVNRYLKMINEENKRLAMLVEEVLQSAVLDKGGFKIKPEEVNLEHLVREVVSKMEIKLKEKKGKISITSDPNGRYEFVGDRIHLTNLFYNLVDNAIKYSREQPEISIEIKNTTNQIAIHVTDNGIGISPEHIKKVFDKLYRVPTGNLHDVKGFGLGLNYVKTIVSRHGGTVEVKSDLGKGSTFSVYFPIQERKENSK